VLNDNVLNPSTGEYEAPLTPEQFVLLPGVLESLRMLRAADYLLFLVSNQPNYAKGKASMKTLDEIHSKLEAVLKKENITFAAFYYCHHHPEFTGHCACRKPSPYFLHEANDKFAVCLADSWMVGDRASDIACGNAAGTRTVRISNSSEIDPDASYTVADLRSATQCILGD